MTVTSETARSSYVGTGALDTYDFTFQILAASELKVVVDGETLVLDTDYTVDGVGDAAGGTITLPADLANGSALLMTRDLPFTQEENLRDLGRLSLEDLEVALDRAVMRDQQLQAQLDRAIVLPDTIDPDDVSAVLPEPESLQLLRWNEDADALENVSPADLVDSAATGDFIVDRFVNGVDYTAGVSTQLTLSAEPGTVNNCDIMFSGLVQNRGTYTIAGAVVTFDAAIPLGVGTIQAKQAHAREINVLGSATVPTAALEDGAVTGPKIADATIPGAKMAAEAIGLREIDSGLLAAMRNALIDGAAALGNGSDYAATVSGTFKYGKSQLCKGALAGTAVAGTLTRSTTSSLGRTGRSFKWSAVTTTGAGLAKWRFFVEAADAVRYKNQTMVLQLGARHDAGVSINYAASVYKANAADDFSAVTAIRTGAAAAVASATNVDVAELAIAMGDCSNGIMVEVVATIGAVTNKNFEITEVALRLGSVVTDVEFPPYSEVLARAQRYFRRIAPPNSGIIAYGVLTTNLGTCAFMLPLPVPMRVVPTIAASSSAAGAFQVSSKDITAGGDTLDTITVGNSNGATDCTAVEITGTFAIGAMGAKGDFAGLGLFTNGSVLDLEARF